jgi:hypothetical protein
VPIAEVEKPHCLAMTIREGAKDRRIRSLASLPLIKEGWLSSESCHILRYTGIARHLSTWRMREESESACDTVDQTLEAWLMLGTDEMCCLA